ncbi:MAG: 50S ribosomal protein L11 methyltransferase [Desulfobacterales bacterium]|nr:MAG: 50S ribosomal protein L11 methyltransferase [Desulfobacterales bacterium]
MQSSSKKTASDCSERIAENQIRNDAIAAIASSPAKVTPTALAKVLSEKYRLAQNQARAIIRELVSDGELAYTYQYGSTYLELSFNRPRKVSQFVVLHPPGYSYCLGPDEVAVQIQSGASFGDGRHPTTRLAIRGIEMVLRPHGSGSNFSRAEILDVGCGSGVLVIAAVRLGAAAGLGIDFDACALAEARHNVQLNALEDRVVISGQPPETIWRRFQMVTANLRYPSLKRLRAQLSLLTAPAGFLVISGIRNIEVQDLLQFYAEKRWDCRWRQSEAGWAGVVLQRTSCRGSRQ